MRNKLWTLGLLAVGALMWGNTAIAQTTSGELDGVAKLDTAMTLSLSETPAPAAADEWDDYAPGKWRFRSYLTVPIPRIDGKAGITRAGRDFDADLSISNSTLMKYWTYTPSTQFELGNGPWIIAFTGLWSRFKDSVNLPNNRGFDWKFDFVVLDLGFGYHLLDIPLKAGDRYPKLGVDPLVGVRWTYLHLNVQPENIREFDRSKSWFDPYVGARARVDFTEKMNVSVIGKIGGFDVDHDKLSWDATAMFEYRFNPKWSVVGGYTAMSWDYKDSEFLWDLTSHGPFVGVSIRY